MTKRIVLLVDDEVHILKVLALKLQNAQFEVRTASNGGEALQDVQEHLPDLVITDFAMPVMTGLELARKLRADDRTQNLPIIMLTARGQTVEEDGDTPRIDALMSKPFSPREILDRVETLLKVRC